LPSNRSDSKQDPGESGRNASRALLRDCGVGDLTTKCSGLVRGGGYRGLFTAIVLEHLEEELAKRHPEREGLRLRDCFDLIAGTSIGGLLACGLALGRPARSLRAAFEGKATAVFPKKRFKTLRQIGGSLYGNGPLAHAIDAMLGEDASSQLREVEHPLLVPCASWVDGKARLFRSAGVAGPDAPTTMLRDVCLATSAAPTYFPSYPLEGDVCLDGGLVANAPDVLAVTTALRLWQLPITEVHVLSIGTAGVDGGSMAGTVPRSGAEWIKGARIINFMMAAQERLAVDTCGALLGSRYQRINHSPGPEQKALADLDVVDASMTGSLKVLASASFERAWRLSGNGIGDFLTSPRP
jgi:predicted acylesterase/phospholipase RssA